MRRFVSGSQSEHLNAPPADDEYDDTNLCLFLSQPSQMGDPHEQVLSLVRAVGSRTSSAPTSHRSASLLLHGLSMKLSNAQKFCRAVPLGWQDPRLTLDL